MESTSLCANDPRTIQQSFYEYFGDIDWNSYTLAQHHVLKMQIGFALFGEPTQYTDKEGETGFKEEENDQINLIYELIKQYHYGKDPDIIIMRIIFIVYTPYDSKDNDISMGKSPVFVVKKCSALGAVDPSECCKIFIDSLGRVYMSWKGYLENNKLPKCIMYCPRNGKYTGTIVENVKKMDNDNIEIGEVIVDLEIHESPACSVSSVVLEVSDMVGTVTSVGATVPILVSMIPAITVAPVILTGAAVTGGIVGVYQIGRCIANLVDRGQHNQTIGLQDTEARACWLGTVAGTVGIGASAATGVLTKLASNGTNISQSARIAYNTLQVTCLIGSGSNLINSGYNIAYKIINKEEISALEIFQFSTSILFFYQSTASFKTARTIVTETQAETLKTYGDELRSNKHRKLFDKAQKESRRINGVIEGNAEIIKGIKNINDPDNFFAGLKRINKDLNKSGARYTITANGEVKINSAHIIDPMEFSKNTPTDRATVLSSLPPPQPTMKQEAFNIKKTEVYKTLNNFAKNNQAVLIGGFFDIAIRISNNETDMSNIALLLRNFSRYVIEKILHALVDVVAAVKSLIEAQLRELFPFVSLPVAVTQFILNFIQEISETINLPLDVYLKMVFDDASYPDFVKSISNDLVNWVETKINKMSITVAPFIEGSKKKELCPVCKGCYFVTS